MRARLVVFVALLLVAPTADAAKPAAERVGWISPGGSQVAANPELDRIAYAYDADSLTVRRDHGRRTREFPLNPGCVPAGLDRRVTVLNCSHTIRTLDRRTGRVSHAVNALPAEASPEGWTIAWNDFRLMDLGTRWLHVEATGAANPQPGYPQIAFRTEMLVNRRHAQDSLPQQGPVRAAARPGS